MSTFKRKGTTQQNILLLMSNYTIFMQKLDIDINMDRLYYYSKKKKKKCFIETKL